MKNFKEKKYTEPWVKNGKGNNRIGESNTIPKYKTGRAFSIQTKIN